MYEVNKIFNFIKDDLIISFFWLKNFKYSHTSNFARIS